MCPFVTYTKRYDIYSIRPQICRMFHCSSSLNKLDEETKLKYELSKHYTIYDLIKDKL